MPRDTKTTAVADQAVQPQFSADHSKELGYDYPNQLPVKMGESVVVDKKFEGQKASTEK